MPPRETGDHPEVSPMGGLAQMEATREGREEFLREKGWRVNKELGQWECDRPKTEFEELITGTQGEWSLQNDIKDPEILSACIGLPEITYGAHASLAANPVLSKEDVLRLSKLDGVGTNEYGANTTEALCMRDNLDLRTIWELNKESPATLKRHLPYSDNYDKRCVFSALDELKKWDGHNPPEFMDFQDFHDLNVKEGLQIEARSSLGKSREEPMDNITREETEQLKKTLADRQPYELEAGLRWGQPWLKTAIAAAVPERARPNTDLPGGHSPDVSKQNTSKDLKEQIDRLRGETLPQTQVDSSSARPLLNPQRGGSLGFAGGRSTMTATVG